MKKFLCMAAALLLTASMIPAVSAAEALPAPVAYYNFDNADFVGADVTGNGWNAELMGDIELKDGKAGKAGYFNGEDTCLRGSIDLDTPTLTLTCWLKPDALPTDFYSFFTNDGWTAGDFHVHMRSDNLINFGINGVSMDVNEGQTEYAIGDWTHVAVVIDAEEGTCVIYQNGEYDTDGLGEGFPNILLDEFSIGCWMNEGAGSRWVKGLIDDFRIYDAALTEEQVIAVMNGEGAISGMGATKGEQVVVEKATYPNSGIEANGTIMIDEIIGADAYSDSYPFANAFDMRTGTFFAAATSGEPYVGVKMKEPYALTQVNFFARTGAELSQRAVGGMIQASNDGAEWTTLYTIEAVTDGEWLVITDLDTTNLYTHFRYIAAETVYNDAPVHLSDIAEIEFYGKTAADIAKESAVYPNSGIEAEGTILFDEVIGEGAYGEAYAAANAFDMAADTFFAAATSGEPYVGVKMNAPHALTQVNLYPRANFAARAAGGMIQGSNDGTAWTTLAVIESAAEGEWLVLKDFTSDAGYTYFRYIAAQTEYDGAPVHLSDIAEIEFYGKPAAAPAETEKTEEPIVEEPVVEEVVDTPAVKEEPAAPQTFDAAVIAAVSALAAAAGYALSKKRR